MDNTNFKTYIYPSETYAEKLARHAQNELRPWEKWVVGDKGKKYVMLAFFKYPNPEYATEEQEDEFSRNPYIFVEKHPNFSYVTYVNGKMVDYDLYKQDEAEVPKTKNHKLSGFAPDGFDSRESGD